MTSPHQLDRRLTDWLADQAPTGAPHVLLTEVCARASRTRRRPAWATSERWISMETRAQLGAIPRMAILLLVLLSLLVLATALAFAAGSSPAPPPYGPSANGLLAFDRDDGDIWVADADGTSLRRWTTDPGPDIDPAWSPDGRHLAYWSLVDPSPPADGTYTPEQVNALVNTSIATLVVTDAMGSERVVLVDGVRLGQLAFTPTWSPDSRRLAYGRHDEGQFVIETVSLDGTAPERIGVGEAPVWSPDGGSIAYRVGPTGVWVAGSDGTEPHQVTTVAGSGSAFLYPQWSPDSTRLAFYAGADGAHTIWVADLSDDTEHQVGEGLGDEFWPSWSPDGGRLAFLRTTDVGHLVIAEPDGGTETQLAPRLQGGVPNVWAPDGTRLLSFTAYVVAPVILDPEGVEPPVTLPAVSPWQSGSWQRLAP